MVSRSPVLAVAALAAAPEPAFAAVFFVAPVAFVVLVVLVVLRLVGMVRSSPPARTPGTESMTKSVAFGARRIRRRGACGS